MDNVLLRALLVETKKVIGDNASMAILSSAYESLDEKAKHESLPILQEMFAALKHTKPKDSQL